MSKRAKRAALRGLMFESLESRIVLATNLQMLNLFFLDGQGNRISRPAIGEQVELEALYRATDLPAGNYVVRFDVDGVSLDVSTNNGAGQSGSRVFSVTQKGWYADGTFQTATATLDPDDAVIDLPADDNSFSRTILTNAPTFQLEWPLEGDPYVETTILNYYDADPRSAMVQDYDGGVLARDGRALLDIGPNNFQLQDGVGIPVLAAMDGIVTGFRDDEFDRDPAPTAPTAPVNVVVIDHGDGWTTSYARLRRDSIEVEIGDVVAAGDQLGLLGGSYIHFGLQRYGRPVEPNFDSSYWVAAPRYALDEVTLGPQGSGITNYDPTPHLTEAPSQVEVFLQDAVLTTDVYAFAALNGLTPTDEVEIEWLEPDGDLFGVTTLMPAQDFANTTVQSLMTLPAAAELGTWTVNFNVTRGGGKTTVGSDTFEMATVGAPEIRIQEGAAIVLNDRHTPIDFGARNINAARPTHTFTVTNHGTADLTLGPAAVPLGYAIGASSTLGTTLAPGASATLVVEMRTDTAGYFGGMVRIDCDDADEGQYRFSVEGLVNPPSGTDSLTIGIGQREITEGRDTIANLRRSGNTSTPLLVRLTSTAEATVPPFVLIPAGFDYALFRIQGAIDAVDDGTQTAVITATALDYADAQNEVDVRDDPFLMFAINGGPIFENEVRGVGPGTTATVTRVGGDHSLPLPVTLTKDPIDDDELDIATTVVIPGGASSFTIPVFAFDDNLLDGAHIVTVTASAAGFLDPDPQSIEVLDYETITLAVSPSVVVENSANPAFTATLTRSDIDDLGNDLVVRLDRIDDTEFDLPATFTIPAGQESVSFDFDVKDDNLLDGTQVIDITPVVTDYFSFGTSVTVLDYESLGLVFARPVVREDAGLESLQVTVSRSNTNTAQPLTVSLTTAGDVSAVRVPPSVQIPSWQQSFTFVIDVLDNTLLGDRTVDLIATAPGYADPTTAQLTVTDHETLTLSFQPASVREDAGMVMATLTRSTSPNAAALNVTLTDTDFDNSELDVPSSVQIPAGSSSVTFAIPVLDDILVDGSQPIMVTASAPGFFDAVKTVTVLDVETLTLTLDVESISEASAQPVRARVSRGPTDASGPLTVFLTSSGDGSELQLPTSVMIPAFDSFVDFDIPVRDDNLLDGPQTVQIVASAAGFFSGTDSVIVTDHETLTIELTPDTVREDAGSGAVVATIRRSNVDNLGAAVNVLLTSSGSALNVPPVIQIPANQAATVVPLTVVDDSLLNGTRLVNVTAASAGYVPSGAALTVEDHEILTLTLAGGAIREDAGVLQATVTRSATNVGQALTVTLASNNLPGRELNVPATVVIPAGRTSVLFDIPVLDDNLLDGPQSIDVVASAPDYFDGAATVVVEDHEVLTLTLPVADFSEGAGTVQATVRRSNVDDLSGPLTVAIGSSNVNELLPTTAVIPIGQSSVDFAITVVNDTLLDGSRNVQLTATAAGYLPGGASAIVRDDEQLTLSFAPPTVPENGGTVLATVTRSNTDTGSPLSVTLANNGSGVVSAPSLVRIPAGQASVSFSVSVLDNATLDGLRTVNFTAAATGYPAAAQPLTVEDHETLTASVTPQLFEGGAGQLVIGRSNLGGPAAPVTVHINYGSADITGPSSVVMGAAEFQVIVAIQAVNDGVDEPPTDVAIEVSADGFIDATATATVFDRFVSPWHSPSAPGDVDFNGVNTTEDLLAVLSDLLLNGARELTLSDAVPPFVDVIPDGFLLPDDLVEMVTILLNEASASNPEGEGVADGALVEADAPRDVSGAVETAPGRAPGLGEPGSSQRRDWSPTWQSLEEQQRRALIDAALADWDAELEELEL